MEEINRDETMAVETGRKKGVPVVIFIICIFTALAVGGLISAVVLGLVTGGGELVDQKKLSSLKKQIDMYYIGDYDKEELAEGAYQGFVKGLDDPYSKYLTKEEYEEDLESFSGSYSGIGITFNENNKGYYEVYEVSAGSPAEKEGIEKGDLILTVDGETYETTEDMAKHIRGEEGTKVTIEYMHKGKTKKAEITRRSIHQETVKWEMMDGDIGYIKIGSFIETTGDDFHEALGKVEENGAKYLILDLRNNGGGLVDQCVRVADEFLDEGVVAHCEDKNGKTETYDARDGKTALKTVVLINGNSASASEILSYALKDNGFTVIGERSYGKGVIQMTLPQKDGSALELTVMEYLSPDRHKVHKKGVSPNIKVEDDPDTETDEQLEKAKKTVKAQ